MAKSKMLKFVETERDMPTKRASNERRDDFLEIYGDYIDVKAKEQASRCSQCGVPFCQNHCPLENNIPDWLKLTAEGRTEEAYRISAATNNMPEICGRICPQDRLCEGSCVIEQSGHGTVTIGSVERYLTDTAWENGWVEPIAPRRELPLSVGIIGAGPAGLATAEQLRLQGWQVTVYDRHDRAGGLLIYGIPNFKLDKAIVERRTQRLMDGGIEFKLNTDIGTDISFDKLREKHDAVMIATGVYKARDLSVPGGGADGVTPALPFLMDSNRRNLGDTVTSETAEGKNVVVIGGGDTAMDCVRTAVRQGAKSVTCLYRRDHPSRVGARSRQTPLRLKQISTACLPLAILCAAPASWSGPYGRAATPRHIFINILKLKWLKLRQWRRSNERGAITKRQLPLRRCSNHGPRRAY